jgi:hypothetical protein
MTKHDTYLDDDTDSDELRRLVETGQLPRSSVVTADDLRMAPGQTLAQKAKALGCTHVTLRSWHLEWRGSGFREDYVIRRGPSNTQPGRYKEKDWPAAIREEIARGRARHVGDILIEVGITAARAQQWSMRHAEFEQALWHSGIPYPPQHWRDWIAWLRLPTIERYRELKAAYIKQGMDATASMHRAADAAVNDLKHRTRQRRRVERDTLLGVTMHEEMTKRWRKGGRLRDAHSKRIAKTLVKVARYAAMEKGLRECGAYTEKEIKAKIGELKTAFAHSPEDGQANWQKLRRGILRKKSSTEAQARADQAEARAIEQMPSVRATKYLKQQLATR